MIRPYGGKVTGSIAALVLALSAASAAEQAVSLSQAWTRVQARSPALAQSASAVRAARALLGQARMLPNPELDFGVEEFGRGSVEVGLALPLEVAGQRRARIQSARSGFDAARLEESATRLRLRAETLRRFAAALALRDQLEAVDTLRGLLGTSVSDISRRVVAGRANDLDLVREQVELKSLEVEARGLERSYDAACRSLSALWAGAADTSWRPSGSFVGRPELQDRAELLALIPGQPASLLGRTSVAAARAELIAARADVFPAPALSGGVSRDVATRENTTRLGVSLPLPLLDLNQGAIQAARHGIAGAEHAASLNRLELEVQANQLLTELATRTEQIDTGYSVILPAHRRILSTLSRHYQQGAVGVTDLIAAQRSLHEAAVELIAAQSERVSLVADLFEITGYEPAVIKE